MHHVLGRQRFEVQLVADREIRRHRFRVVVDDDGLIARMAQRFYAVHRRIVELHALSDTDRSRSEHDDLLAVADDRLVFLLVAGIQVRCGAGEFPGACVDHLVDRHYAVLLTHLVQVVFAHLPVSGDIGIREAVLLELAKDLDIFWMVRHLLFQVDDLLDMVQKEWIHARNLLDRFPSVAVAQPLGDHEDPLVVALLHLVFQFFPVHLGDRSLVQVVDLHL